MARESQHVVEDAPAGGHLCALCQNPLDAKRTAAAFVKDGINRGERCICAVGDDDGLEIGGILEAAGVDVQREFARRILLLVSRRVLDCGQREVDRGAAIGYLDQATREAELDGFAGLRLMVEASHLLYEPDAPASVARYETQVNSSLRRTRALVLCRYDQHRPSADTVCEILRTHPMVMLGEQVYSNPYYEPADLAGGATDTSTAEWMVAQVKRLAAAARGGCTECPAVGPCDSTAPEQALEALRRCHERLQRMQQMGMVGQMAGQVAHDLNNLLTPLSSYPELIKMKLPKKHPAVALCDAMLEASEEITRITAALNALRMYLPVGGQVAEPGEEGLPGGTEAILVIDADRLQRSAIQHLLAALGYRVDTVGSGPDAVEYVARQAVDLMILDTVTPSGIDGLETYRRVLRVRPAQHAIILSGHAESEQVEEMQAMGAGIYLRKPVSLERLARAVRDELDRPC